MIRLIKTCSACPEQYDAYSGKKRVGHLHLRHGVFTVECPFGGDIVYSAIQRGDGVFAENERDYYLKRAVRAIQIWMRDRASGSKAPEVEYVIEDQAYGL